jgi:endonuclease YncB( thermonuclease family)
MSGDRFNGLRVIDGDSIEYGGNQYRLAGYDARPKCGASRRTRTSGPSGAEGSKRNSGFRH